MSRVGRMVVYGLLAFVAVTGILLAIFGGPGGRRAVLFSAGLALVVQVVALCMTRLASSEKLFQAWGAGAVLRLLTIVVYALVLIKPLGLAPVAALLSLATLLFVTTVPRILAAHVMKLGSLIVLALTATRLAAQSPEASQRHSPSATPVDIAQASMPAQAPAPAELGTRAEVNHQANVSLGAEPGAEHGANEKRDIIMPHITDSHHIEIPWINAEWGKEIELPRWAPLRIGSMSIDLSPTKHVVMLLLAATLCALTLIAAAQAHKRHTHATGSPKGFAAGTEAMVLYIRDEVILNNVGHHGNGFVPYLLTLFFFVLFANVLGLIPYGSTATGNISVTAMLAIMSFVTIEIAGMRALGSRYLSTIFYWPSDEPFSIMKVVLFLILTPVELLGKFTKPFALAIRLFANMTAGHVVVLAFIGIIFTFGSVWIAPAPFLMALGIMVLEVLVAFIQAYLFTLLTSVFIGQIREAHH